MLAIAITGLQKSLAADFRGRRTVLLHDINLSVEPASIHGLVGANGAGKSTTLRILVGVARPTTGTAELFGRSSFEAAARVGLGFSPDMASFPLTLTPLEVLKLHAALGPGNETIEAVLHEVDLYARRNDPIGRFSKGMQQRLSLAVALLGSPRLLVLDEPMSGLDPAGRELVRQVLRLRHTQGVTILFSSHVLSDIGELCDAVTVIDKGRTVYAGSLQSLTGDAQGHRAVFAANAALPSSWIGPGRGNIRGDRLLVEVDSDAELQAALAVASDLALRITSIESVRPRLEERLVSLMTGEVA